MSKGIPGVAVAASAVGGILLWAGLKGASVSEVIKSLVKGEAPKGENKNPIYAPLVGSALAGTGIGIAQASQILQIAAKYKGMPYRFGAGHGSDFMTSKYTDCSSYVSRVLNEAGVMKGVQATGGLAKIGTAVPYAQRGIGDIIVWNGGTGGGHVGIIATIEGNGGQMWNNPCTKCGGVQLSKYPYGARTAASAVVRRVTAG